MHEGGQSAATKTKPQKTYSHGQVATINGKHYMKVGANRYAPVTQGKGGSWTHDESRHGIQIHKDNNGKVSYSRFKAQGHEVMRATMRGEEKTKGALHTENKITQSHLKAQKKELVRNPVHAVEHLKPGHIVRVKIGSTIGKEDQKKEGIVGRIKKIVGGVAHIANDVGRHFEVPLHTLAMAKSKDGMIRLEQHPRATVIMLKALRRDD